MAATSEGHTYLDGVLVAESLHAHNEGASCGNVPKLLPLTAATAATADLPSSSKSSHGDVF